MKNAIVVLVICAAAFLFGCNMKGKDESNKAIIGTDSSMMSVTDTTANIAATAMHGDSDAAGGMMAKRNDSVIKLNMAKPDPYKKG